MAQTLFEQNGGTYTQQGDYLLPDIKLLERPEYEIGVWVIVAESTLSSIIESSIIIC